MLGGTVEALMSEWERSRSDEYSGVVVVVVVMLMREKGMVCHAGQPMDETQSLPRISRSRH